MNGIRRQARVFAMGAVVLLVLSGCSRNTPADEPATSPTTTADDETLREANRSRRFVAKVLVEATGTASFMWEGEQEIALTRVGRPGLPVNVFSAGFMLPQPLETDRSLRFRWAVDLANAYADQPATFTIEPAAEGQQLPSGAFLVWMKVKDPSKDAVFDMAEVEFLEQFNRVMEPCELRVGEGERTGGLRCPRLANADGKTVSLNVRWEQTGPDLPAK